MLGLMSTETSVVLGWGIGYIDILLIPCALTYKKQERPQLLDIKVVGELSGSKQLLYFVQLTLSTVVGNKVSHKGSVRRTNCGEQLKQKTVHRTICWEQLKQKTVHRTVCGEQLKQKTVHRTVCGEQLKQETLHRTNCREQLKQKTVHRANC